MASVLVLVVGLAAPAGAGSDQVLREDIPYGYFYGTFGASPNIVLVAGGRAEDFCPEGFDGSPGTVAARTFLRADGTVDVQANAARQPIHLYETGPEAPVWIAGVCANIATEGPPVPFASGTAVLTIRDTFAFEGGPPLRIFNSVNGTAAGPDGTKYRVRAEADIPFDEDGNPVGIPPDWVSLDLRQIGR